MAFLKTIYWVRTHWLYSENSNVCRKISVSIIIKAEVERQWQDYKLATFNKGSTCSNIHPMTACPASWYAIISRSSDDNAWLFFSIPTWQKHPRWIRSSTSNLVTLIQYGTQRSLRVPRRFTKQTSIVSNVNGRESPNNRKLNIFKWNFM